jgi:hypothetical protein
MEKKRRTAALMTGKETKYEKPRKYCGEYG